MSSFLRDRQYEQLIEMQAMLKTQLKMSSIWIYACVKMFDQSMATRGGFTPGDLGGNSLMILMISLFRYLMQTRKGLSLIHVPIVSISILQSLQGGDRILPVGAQGVMENHGLVDQILKQLVD